MDKTNKMTLKIYIFAEKNASMELSSIYQNEQEPQKKQRYLNWQAAKGLQAVDGIKTSAYLDKVAADHIEGSISAYEASKLIDAYYDVQNDRAKEADSEEADKVAARINILIGEGGFSLTTEELKSIHHRLFEGIFNFAGEFRKNNIMKHEWVLDGDTVTYGNSYNLEESVESALRAERLTPFHQLDQEELLYHFSSFTANLWRIHPFGEGNTRTTAVFLIKYLRSIGFEVNNALFEQHSRYFRDALVRANYNNLKKGIYADRDYLDSFMSDLIMETQHSFRSRELHIYAQQPAVKKRLQPHEWEEQIRQLIKENPRITRAQMAEAMDVSPKTIERKLKEIPSVHYTGSSKSGEWVIDPIGS